MIRTIVRAGALAAGLGAVSACGGQDDKSVFMAACTAANSAAICQCEFDKAKAELSEYTFGAMVEAAKIADGAEANRFLLENLSPDQRMTYLHSRMRWIIECDGEESEVAPGQGEL